jgi:hypothetical protein
MRGRRAHALSRRDLLRAGAAGLVGLGLPIAAPRRARAGTCFPFGPNSPILYAAGSSVKDPAINPLLNCISVSAPSLNNGTVCVTATNICNSTLVLVGYIYNAPNAGAFDCFATNNFLQGETLISILAEAIPPGQSQLCLSVPQLCLFQADFALFQFDAAAFQLDAILQNPGLPGVPVGIPVPLTDQNIVAGLLVGGSCQNPTPACIRMTGGGHDDTITTLGGITVTSKAGFQLRTNGHSNLELHWTMNGVDHVFKVGPGDATNFTGAFTSGPNCPGGGQPLNDPNTILGTADGTLDGQPATIFLNFVDCGEPGTNDTRRIIVFDGNNVPQLVADGTIQNGNNQAHKCNA